LEAVDGFRNRALFIGDFSLSRMTDQSNAGSHHTADERQQNRGRRDNADTVAPDELSGAVKA
jgi:hypothetical protein